MNHHKQSLAAAFHSAPIYAIYDTQASGPLPVLDVVKAWQRAGILAIQYRHKGEFGRAELRDCLQLSQRIHEAGGIFVINDRADVALYCHADGVHVGQEDLTPVEVRKLLPVGNLVGHSTHNTEQVASALAMPIDYLAVGPVFPTASKLDPDPVVGLALVEKARLQTRLPLVAIGGIVDSNLGLVLQAGADAVAMIGGLASGCASPEEVYARARAMLTAATQVVRPSPREP